MNAAAEKSVGAFRRYSLFEDGARRRNSRGKASFAQELLRSEIQARSGRRARFCIVTAESLTGMFSKRGYRFANAVFEDNACEGAEDSEGPGFAWV